MRFRVKRRKMPIDKPFLTAYDMPYRCLDTCKAYLQYYKEVRCFPWKRSRRS